MVDSQVASVFIHSLERLVVHITQQFGILSPGEQDGSEIAGIAGIGVKHILDLSSSPPFALATVSCCQKEPSNVGAPPFPLTMELAVGGEIGLVEGCDAANHDEGGWMVKLPPTPWSRR
jgi:hypothetical protein